jgi:RNA polymerase sigma-70 factor (ECF subfamily)
MKNREDAEEVTQDVLLKVYSKIGAFRGDSALSSWIYRITFNTAMSRLRTRKAERAAESESRTVSTRSVDRGEGAGRPAELLTGHRWPTTRCCVGSFVGSSHAP